MRSLMAVAAFAIVLLLGAIQVLASVALRERAQRGAWVGFVPASVGRAVDRLDPALPVPSVLRLVLARNAVAAHDLPVAEREAARLPPSADRLDLQAALAEAHGDRARAARDYLAAGDLAALEARVEELRARGSIGAALALQQAAVARLGEDRTQVDTLAQATFRLGRLEETQAYALAVGAPARRAHERRALDAYARAVALAPLEENYLIAYANQQLNLGDLAAAARVFARARDVDPTSAEPLAGLGDAAYRRGDLAAARAYLERARALDARSAAVRRLANELHR